jgi:hypothetical protein
MEFLFWFNTAAIGLALLIAGALGVQRVCKTYCKS